MSCFWMPLDKTFVKEIQFCLTKNTYDTRRWQLGECPGEYKRHDYVTGRKEVGAAPEDVADEMRELLEELRDATPGNALTAAAYFHAKFENIHPFADGNGRVGRLAMNYLLVLHGHPPTIIHEEDRKEYYAVLEAWDTRQELALLREFLIRQTGKTLEKQVARAEGKKGQTSMEGILIVLPLSCSITPPVGEGEDLQQMEGGVRCRGPEKAGFPIFPGPFLFPMASVVSHFARWAAPV